MTAYIIAYSIILVLIAAATVVISVLWVRSQKARLGKRTEADVEQRDGEHAFVDIFGRGSNATFILTESDTHTPVYISPNISEFFGMGAEKLLLDLYAVSQCVGKKDWREFTRSYGAWNGEGTYSVDFGYGENKHGRAQARRVVTDKSYDAFIVYDVTEQMEEKQRMSEELDSAKIQAADNLSFLSSMSHEIRTPMNGVMGMMALARMNINDPKKAASYLERAGDLSVFLLGMINDILDISKLESGKMQLFNTTIDINAFAEKIRSMFTGMITSKGVEFLVETVDFTPTSRYLTGDELRLTQVVTNFVSNANKFTPQGGKISVTFKQLDIIDGSVKLLIRVRDTGKGIAPENIHKIMRPFEQEEASTAHNYGGTGLGLAICDNIVRLMGGNIVVDSVLGKGSDFSVFLSLPVAEAVQEPAEEERKTAALGEDFTFDGCRILLAEDNEVNAEIAVEILESEGAIVTLAHDGQEALEIFNDKPDYSFDLILLDIQMPRLNGRDTAKAIRGGEKAHGKTVPIIALSADAFVEDVAASKAAGMDDHVSKPIDFDMLRKVSGAVIADKNGKAAKKSKAAKKKK